MNKANQNALYQQTNQGLLGIRQAEISYYINLCVAFGTQAALVGGFTYGIFTQNQFNEETGYSKYFQDVYWVSSSGTIAASVHVILTSMLLQVLGPGLALHDNPLTTSLLTSQVADSTPQGLRELAMEGFLLIKRFSYSLSTSDKHSFKWERRYFTLNYLGHLFYYNSRTDFRENPRRPIHKRPLMLQDFFVVVRNSERDGDNVSSFRSVDSNMPGLERAHSITSTLSAATAMTPGHNHYDTGNRGKSGVHVFEITLIPRENEKQFRRLNLQQHQHQQLVAGGQEIDSRRGDSDDNMSQSDHDSVSNEETETSKFLGKQEYKRDWVLRCDTAEELTVWVDVIRDVCPSCFR
eukprot:gene1306-956_t